MTFDRLRGLIDTKFGCVWVFLFLSVNLIFDHDYGTNPLSRFAALCAMVEDKSFRIDNYKHLTIDWSQTPDGYYYSNKAPGPILLGYPIFWVFDNTLTSGEAQREKRDILRLSYRDTGLKLLSITLQVVPYSILCLCALAWLRHQGVSYQGVQLACVALLFGHTATLFMNTFFGHALTATFVLALVLCILNHRYFVAGFCFGFAWLSDYTAVLLLPSTLASIILQNSWRRSLSVVVRFGSGGILPGVLWIVYHVSCFGSPFIVPNSFQNPIFVNHHDYKIWGNLNYFPSPRIVLELLFGMRRGILWTQPWIFALLPCLLHVLVEANKRKEELRKPIIVLTTMLLPSLFFVIWLIASFEGWHGGSTPGPRYLSLLFSPFGLLLGITYDRVTNLYRAMVCATLYFSICFFIVLFSTTILTPETDVPFERALSLLLASDDSNAPIKFLILLSAFACAFYFTFIRSRPDSVAITQSG